MRKLAREEEKEEEQRQKKRKTKQAAEVEEDEDEESSDEAEDADDAEEAEETFEIPKHESLVEATDTSTSEVERAARTVFLGNVSTECITSKSAEKVLKKHLESFIADLADNTPPHKIESIRFRSTAFGSSLPKRAAFAKKEIMDTTTKSTNAYAVYTTKVAAREAVKKLNGSVLAIRVLIPSTSISAMLRRMSVLNSEVVWVTHDKSSGPSSLRSSREVILTCESLSATWICTWRGAPSATGTLSTTFKSEVAWVAWRKVLIRTAAGTISVPCKG